MPTTKIKKIKGWAIMRGDKIIDIRFCNEKEIKNTLRFFWQLDRIFGLEKEKVVQVEIRLLKK
jgi:hypothetical protein